MKTCRAHDFMELSSREMTADGYMVARNCTLARTGVQTYRAYELGLDADGMDPMRVIRLHRPAEEVFDPVSMASFESKPVTIDHPPVAVTADNWAKLAKGEGRDICRMGDLMCSTLIIKSKDAIDAVQSGKNQLSNGYTFDLDMTPGTTHNGQAYDGVQRNIRGNHIAIVDAARCGSACRIADSDSSTQGAKTMADALRKVIVDGIPLEVNDTAAAAIDKLQKQLTAALDAQVTATKVDLKVGDSVVTVMLVGDSKPVQDAFAKLVSDHAAEVETLKKDVITPEARDAMVADWAKLIGDAKRLVPDLVTDGKTCVQIRREAVAALAKDGVGKAVAEAVLAGKTAADADADTIRTAFAALSASIKTAGNDAITQANDALANALTKQHQASDATQQQEQPTQKLVGRDAMIARQTQAWRGGQK